MYDDSGDRSQAFQYHYESFRYSPTSIDVISWLGAYYMETQFADKAIRYFERAALIQPTQINWQLMVASCYRKIGELLESCVSEMQSFDLRMQLDFKMPVVKMRQLPILT